jgi:Ran-binding protein 1
MQLKPNIGSDRAWIWQVLADFADEVPKQELLAIRFANSENAQKFKAKFEECQNQISETKDNASKVADKLSQLTVTEESGDKEKAEQSPDVKDANKETAEESKEETPKKTEELIEQGTKTQESKEETEQDSKSSSDVKTEETGGGQC